MTQTNTGETFDIAADKWNICYGISPSTEPDRNVQISNPSSPGLLAGRVISHAGTQEAFRQLGLTLPLHIPSPWSTKGPDFLDSANVTHAHT